MFDKNARVRLFRTNRGLGTQTLHHKPWTSTLLDQKILKPRFLIRKCE